MTLERLNGSSHLTHTLTRQHLRKGGARAFRCCSSRRPHLSRLGARQPSSSLSPQRPRSERQQAAVASRQLRMICLTTGTVSLLIASGARAGAVTARRAGLLFPPEAAWRRHEPAVGVCPSVCARVCSLARRRRSPAGRRRAADTTKRPASGARVLPAPAADEQLSRQFVTAHRNGSSHTRWERQPLAPAANGRRKNGVDTAVTGP